MLIFSVCIKLVNYQILILQYKPSKSNFHQEATKKPLFILIFKTFLYVQKPLFWSEKLDEAGQTWYVFHKAETATSNSAISV